MFTIKFFGTYEVMKSENSEKKNGDGISLDLTYKEF